MLSPVGVLHVASGSPDSTSDRPARHKRGASAFTAKYRIRRLVYFEVFRWVWDAIVREKQIKRWRREKKVALIERVNPEWTDLADRLDEMKPGLEG